MVLLVACIGTLFSPTHLALYPSLLPHPVPFAFRTGPRISITPSAPTSRPRP